MKSIIYWLSVLAVNIFVMIFTITFFYCKSHYIPVSLFQTKTAITEFIKFFK
jgi:hypothetical protein